MRKRICISLCASLLAGCGDSATEPASNAVAAELTVSVEAEDGQVREGVGAEVRFGERVGLEWTIRNPGSTAITITESVVTIRQSSPTERSTEWIRAELQTELSPGESLEGSGEFLVPSPIVSEPGSYRAEVSVDGATVAGAEFDVTAGSSSLACARARTMHREPTVLYVIIAGDVGRRTARPINLHARARRTPGGAGTRGSGAE